MFISIIICTLNRATELKECIAHLIKQVELLTDAEIIVVDNGSIDNTYDVVRNYLTQSNYAVRYVFEPSPGLCVARNRGRNEAKGKILAYIDDDVRVGENWVSDIRHKFITNPSINCLGGNVNVSISQDISFKISKDLYWFFGETNFGTEYRELHSPEHPIGCNMAIRAIVFDNLGGFDTGFKLYGDETEFFSRVVRSGYNMFYSPGMSVSQVIPHSRLTYVEVKKKSLLWGRGSAKYWFMGSKSFSACIFQLISYSAKYVYMSTRMLFKSNFSNLITTSFYRGYISGLLSCMFNWR